jgi:hypothetical protein
MTEMLSKLDEKCLRKIDADGWWFDDGRSHRPRDLEERELLEGALRLFRWKPSGSIYKKAYRLTPKGRHALGKEACRGDDAEGHDPRCVVEEHASR